MLKIQVWDNGGKTCDRYTIKINGELYSSSEHPTHPQGFGQYCGTNPRYKGSAGEKRIGIDKLSAEVRRHIAYRAGLID